MIQYSRIVTGPLAENCYLVWPEGETTCWIIDPGADAEDIIQELKARELTPVAIVLTHGHFDHVGALNELGRAYPALTVYMTAKDAEWAFTHAFNQYPPYYLHQQRPVNLMDYPGESLSVGGITAHIIATPGHTPGGVCLFFEQEQPICFTGDTLFAGSIGRTDLPGGSFGELNASLQVLKTLPTATTFLPGHGEGTTLASELLKNPYLQPEPEF